MKRLLESARRARHFTRTVRRKTAFAVSPPPLILCYHRVFEPETDPHLLCVSRAHFREHLEVIKRLAQPASLDQLVEAITRKNFPRRGVVITFDDGYVDNFEHALPLLRDANLPATIYIATGYVGTEREFWWDDLARLVLGPVTLPEALRIEIDGGTRTWQLRPSSVPDPAWHVLAPGARTPRQNLFCELDAALRPLAEPTKQSVLAQLRKLTGIPAKARPRYRCMSAPELKTLAAEPLITLGAHTVSHCQLTARTPDEQGREIDGSKRQLEEFTGAGVAHFSYPYGSFNEETVALARGFHSAVSLIAEPVDRSAPLHRLPRFLVRDWDGPQFERQLTAWFRG
ncbi:MAG: polysaccharide deacetylase family protein [Chthoniobacterales bacterium]